MVSQLLLLIFLVVLAFYFGVAFLLWRNLKLYNVPQLAQTKKLNMSFLSLTLLFIVWATVALMNLS